MPTIKKLMLNGIAYKRKEGTPIPDDALLLESGKEILLENGNYLAKEVPLPPTLLSYEEIKAMAQNSATENNAITELNTDVTGYYNKFNSEGHIRTDGVQNLLSDDGTSSGCWYSASGTFVGYLNGTRQLVA